MYTFNTKLGIGQVQSIENQIVTIYFEDEDTTKKVHFGFVTIYRTEEDAENASNQVISQEELEDILSADNARHENRMNNQEAIRLMNLETSMNCAKSL